MSSIYESLKKGILQHYDNEYVESCDRAIERQQSDPHEAAIQQVTDVIRADYAKLQRSETPEFLKLVITETAQSHHAAVHDVALEVKDAFRDAVASSYPDLPINDVGKAKAVLTR